MVDRLAQFARGSSPIVAALCGVAGGLAGGGVYLSFSGIVLGVLMGLGIGGAVVVVTSLLASIIGVSDEAPARIAPRAANVTPIAIATMAIPGTAGHSALLAADKGHQVMNDKSPVQLPAGAVVSTVPAEAGIPVEVLDVTQSEAQLLAAGRFDHYHLAKAKRLFEAKNYKEAAYQCAASLSHGSIPEAAALRKSALAAMK